MKKSILIVDDDVANLKMAELILNQEYYELHCVKTGLDALRFLKRKKADLILLDIQMPIMSGIKTLEKIRAEKDLADIPVIILTSSGDKETIVDACRLEVVDYIIKPFIPTDLLERVRKAL